MLHLSHSDFQVHSDIIVIRIRGVKRDIDEVCMNGNMIMTVSFNSSKGVTDCS